MSKAQLITVIAIIMVFTAITTYKNFSEKLRAPFQSKDEQIKSVEFTTLTETKTTAGLAPDSSSKPRQSSTPIPTIPTSSVKIRSISPTTLNFGDELRISGSGFGSTMGRINLYNKIMGQNNAFSTVIPRSWTDTEISINIPPVVGGQLINLEVVHQDGTKSNRMQFTVNGGQPRIDSINPKNSAPLQNIEISGAGFGSSNGSIDLFQANSTNFNTPNAHCDIISWNDSTLKCRIPGSVNSDNEYGFQIVSSDGRKSSFVYYRVGN